MNTDQATNRLSLSVPIGAPSVATSLVLPLPSPRRAIEIVAATMEDVDWIDDLQKRHRDRVGFQMRGAIEGKIRLGQVIVAKEGASGRQGEGAKDDAVSSPPRPVSPSPTPQRLGYCMASDRYMKREDCGIIYQLNVEPHAQRWFVGAAMLKAQFDRSPYGVRLYCCWCAQDIAANRFWEAMGFVPLAYRAGSERRSRVHIFWQKRIREGDTGENATPWWFPSQSQGGAMDDRLVFPIRPGTRWSDAVPVILPRQDRGSGVGCRVSGEEKKRLPGSSPSSRSSRNPKPDTRNPIKIPLSGGLCFAPPAPAPVAGAEKKPREKREKRKNDPVLVAKARELRDRYLEHVNGGALVLESAGKYDVARALPSASAGESSALPALPALPAIELKQLPHAA